MKKFSTVLAALAAALLGLALVAPAAQAYPEDTMQVDVNRDTVRSGQMIVARASADTSCQWTATFNDETETDSGFRMNVRFRAPVVDEPTTFDLVVTCTYTTGSAAGTAIVKAADVTRTVPITVLPARGQGAPPAQEQGTTGGLPQTGGPNAWLLGGGAALLLAGAGAVVVSRRRAAGN